MEKATHLGCAAAQCRKGLCLGDEWKPPWDIYVYVNVRKIKEVMKRIIKKKIFDFKPKRNKKNKRLNGV